MSEIVRRRRGVLFVCVANSARSQIAEGLLRSLAGERFEVFSAGSAPAGSVHPHALRVLEEVGIDASGHRSKSLEEIDAFKVDTVITLCAEEVCPVFPHAAERLHWPLPDPAVSRVGGAAELEAFRWVREELRRRLEVWLGNPPPREESLEQRREFTPQTYRGESGREDDSGSCPAREKE